LESNRIEKEEEDNKMNETQLTLRCTTKAGKKAAPEIGQAIAERIRLYASPSTGGQANALTVTILDGIFALSGPARLEFLMRKLDPIPAVDDLAQEVLEIVQEYQDDEHAA